MSDMWTFLLLDSIIHFIFIFVGIPIGIKFTMWLYQKYPQFIGLSGVKDAMFADRKPPVLPEGLM